MNIFLVLKNSTINKCYFKNSSFEATALVIQQRPGNVIICFHAGCYQGPSHAFWVSGIEDEAVISHRTVAAGGTWCSGWALCWRAPNWPDPRMLSPGQKHWLIFHTHNKGSSQQRLSASHCPSLRRDLGQIVYFLMALTLSLNRKLAVFWAPEILPEYSMYDRPLEEKTAARASSLRLCGDLSVRTPGPFPGPTAQPRGQIEMKIQPRPLTKPLAWQEATHSRNRCLFLLCGGSLWVGAALLPPAVPSSSGKGWIL